MTSPDSVPNFVQQKRRGMMSVVIDGGSKRAVWRLCIYACNLRAVGTDIKQKWLRLKATLETQEVSQEALAIAAGINQATVSRILGRCPKRAGAAFIRLCIYANRVDEHGSRPDPALSDELMNALRDVWNGSDEHAKALAAIIRAAGYATHVGAR